MSCVLEPVVIQIVNGLLFGSYLALLAMGFTLITMASRSINFVYGDIPIIAAVITYLLFPVLSNYWAATILASLVGGLIGLVVGALTLHSQSTANSNYMYPLALTFGFFLVFREVESIVLAGAMYKPDAPIPGSIDIGMMDFVYPSYRVFVGGVSFLLLLLAWILVTRTRVGALIRAAIADRELLSCAGVRVSTVVVSTFVISAVLSGVAGALMSPILGFHEESGLDILLWCILTVFFGGAGSLLGCLIGGLLLGQVFYLSVLWLDPRLAEFTVFATVVVFLLFRSRGLLGDPAYQLTD